MTTLTDEEIAAIVLNSPGPIETCRNIEEAVVKKLEAKNLAVQEGLDEHYREAQTSIIRATVAAVMEAALVNTAQADAFTLVMNLEAQRTIWDRFEFETARSDDGSKVVFTLTRK